MHDHPKQELVPAQPGEEHDLRDEQLELARQIVDLDRERVEANREEVRLHHEQATKALDLNAQDRREERQTYVHLTRMRLWVVGLVAAAIFILVGVALFVEQPDIAKQIIEAVVYLGAGGIGGYAAGRLRGSENADG